MTQKTNHVNNRSQNVLTFSTEIIINSILGAIKNCKRANPVQFTKKRTNVFFYNEVFFGTKREWK